MENTKWIGKEKNIINDLGTDGYPLAKSAMPEKEVCLSKRSVLLRKTFEISKSIKYAEISVCGLGFYYLFINGRKPCDDIVLAPLYSAYSKKTLYDVFEITEMLASGRNSVAIELGSGWYSPPDFKWDGWRMRWYGSPRAAAKISIEFTDGTKQTVETDASWKLYEGGVIESSIYDGETYDANFEPNGWQNTDFDDDKWNNAVEVEQPTENIVRNSAPPIKVINKVKAVAVEKMSDNEYIYDFGENLTALPYIEAIGEKNDCIVMECAEFLYKNGSLDRRSNNKALNTDKYIFLGVGTECYRPHFTFHCYRYLKVTLFGKNVKLIKIESHNIHSDVKVTGHFECGNKRLNYLHECFVRSQLNCLMGVPIDCPQRDERLPWLGDGHATCEMSIYNFDMEKLYANWLNDMAVGKTKQNTVQFIAPSVLDDTTIDWNIAFPIILWQCYCRYGDRKLLEDNYDCLKGHIDYYIGISSDGLISNCTYGDWMSIDKADGAENVVVGTSAKGDNRNPEYNGSLFYFYSLKLMSDIAKLVGNENDYLYYKKQASKTKRKLLNKYFNKNTLVFGFGGQFVHSFVLNTGLIPVRYRNGVLDNLLSEIEKANYTLLTGVIGTKNIFDVLISYGKKDVAYKLLTKEGNPSLMNMVSGGRTTLPERWNTDFIPDNDNLNSGCHCMFASPDTTLYRMLGGITVDRTAKYSVCIEPYIADNLHYVNCLQTVKEGEIVSNWRKDGNKVGYHIEIPVGIKAKILINGKSKILNEGSYDFEEREINE